jgi:hypothetical protein
MRYEMQKRWFWGAIIFMCCATGAFAETDSFTLTGVTQSGNNMGGVYTSPYVATINNTQSGVSVICDDFADDVEVGESWTVLSTNLSGLSQSTSANSADTFLKWDTSSTAAAQVQDYMTVAILSAQLLSIDSSTTEAADLSFAIWDVFTPSASTGLADSATITGYLQAAEKLAAINLSHSSSIAQALSLDNISNVTIYTATPDDGGAVTTCPSAPCGGPQEFIRISMAEPPSPALLGLDLLAVAGLVLFVRRRLKLA